MAPAFSKNHAALHRQKSHCQRLLSPKLHCQTLAVRPSRSDLRAAPASECNFVPDALLPAAPYRDLDTPKRFCRTSCRAFHALPSQRGAKRTHQSRIVAPTPL
jgi:hypothetical protein